MRHSWGQTKGLRVKKRAKGPAAMPGLQNPSSGPGQEASRMVLSYPSHFDPPLHHFSPLLRLQGPVSETRGDDAVGHAIELRHRGTDGGCQVLFAFLVSLRPDAAQAVVRHHFLKQLLEDKGMEMGFFGKRGSREQGSRQACARSSRRAEHLLNEYSQHPSA